MRIERPFNITLCATGPEETLRLGHCLARLLREGDVLAFTGELGAGKTCLIRGICDGLGVADDVTSPTFTLINEYRGRLPVYHFDLYRMESADSVFDLGIEEYLDGGGVCLIEWAEKYPEVLPDARVAIRLQISSDTTRDIQIVELVAAQVVK